jgi:hypothetical protein
MSFFKHKVPPDVYAYLGFIFFYVIAYRGVLALEVPFWAVNLSPLPSSAYSFVPGQFVWFPGFLGSVAQPNIALWLQYIFVQVSGNNLVLAEKLMISGTLVSCFSMYFFISNHFKGRRIARFAVALIYGFGPATVFNFSGFILWGYVALPIVFNYMLNLFDGSRKLTDILLLGLSLSFMTAFYPQLLPMVIISFLIFLIVRLISVAGKLQYIKKMAISFAGTVLVFASTSPYLISGGYHLITTIGWFAPPDNVTYLNVPASSSNPSLYFATYANQEILNTIRLIGGSPGNHLDESNLLSFILPVFAFASILLACKGKKMLNLIALSLTSLFAFTLIYGIHLHAGWAMWLLYHTPLSLFYYPESPINIIAFAYSVMAFVTLDTILLKVANIHLSFKTSKYFYVLKKQNFKKACMVIIVALLLATTFLSAPVFSQEIQQERYVPLPPIYSEIQDWLDSTVDSENYRVLFLPTDSFSAVLGVSNVFESTSGYATAQTDQYVNFVLNQLAEGTSSIGNLLAPASVKYIIVATPDPNTLWSGTPALAPPLPASNLMGPLRYVNGEVQGDPSYIEQMLDRQSDLQLIYTAQNFRVYENLRSLQKISCFSSATFVIGSEDALSALTAMPGFNANTEMLIFANQNPNLAQELSAVSSSIVFFNADITDYLSLGSASNATAYDVALNQMGLKNQLYLFNQTNSTFSLLVAVPAGTYSFALSNDNLRSNCSNLSIDAVDVIKTQTIDVGWETFGSIKLPSGIHNFTVTNGSPGSLLAIYNTENLSQIFAANSPVIYKFSKLGQTSYSLSVKADTPVFISLSESYYPNWLAYAEEKSLVHFTAFSFSNAYYIDSNKNEHIVTIDYNPPIISYIYVSQEILFGIIGSIAITLIIITKIRRVQRNKNKPKGEAVIWPIT